MSRHVLELGHSRLVAAFSLGDFKPLGNKVTKATTHVANTEDILNVNPEESNKAAGVYSCPQDGCVHIFQRVLPLKKQLSLEKCTRSPETYCDRSSQNGLQVRSGGGRWRITDPKNLKASPGSRYCSCQGGMGSKSCQKNLSV